jgi:protein TonB
MRERFGLDVCLVGSDPEEQKLGTRRRARSLATSFVLQAAVVAVLVLAPLAATGELPRLTAVILPRIDPPRLGSPNAPPDAEGSGTTPRQGRTVRRGPKRPPTGPLLQPPRIPTGVGKVTDDAWVNSDLPGTGERRGVRGGADDGTGILGLLGPHNPAPASPPEEMRRISTGVIPGQPSHRVEPRYPAIAVQTRREGNVVLRIVIGTDGAVRDVEVVSGHILLVEAAVEAVWRWRYQPTLLNGEPVEVQGTVVVQFRLNR